MGSSSCSSTSSCKSCSSTSCSCSSTSSHCSSTSSSCSSTRSHCSSTSRSCSRTSICSSRTSTHWRWTTYRIRSHRSYRRRMCGHLVDLWIVHQFVQLWILWTCKYPQRMLLILCCFQEEEEVRCLRYCSQQTRQWIWIWIQIHVQDENSGRST